MNILMNNLKTVPHKALKTLSTYGLCKKWWTKVSVKNLWKPYKIGIFVNIALLLLNLLPNPAQFLQTLPNPTQHPVYVCM